MPTLTFGIINYVNGAHSFKYFLKISPYRAYVFVVRVDVIVLFFQRTRVQVESLVRITIFWKAV